MPGSIDQIRNGRYRLRMYVSGKQQTIGFYDTRDEATAAAESHALVLEETAAEFEGLTLAQFGKKILTAREIHAQVRDPDSDWSRWNTHIKPDPLAAIPLRRLQTQDISQWLRRLEQKKLAPQTRRNCLNLLRVVLTEAHADGKLKVNPSLGVRVKGKSGFAWTYLNPTEQRALLEALTGEERCLVAFAIGTGLRAGELCALRVADVHLGERPRIVVRYGGPPDRPTKTGTLRTVPLFGVAIAAANAWVCAHPNPHGLLFPRERGGFRSKDHVIPWGSWKDALKRAGIARRLRWHDLRHTCASSLVSGWWGRRWSLQEVKEVLGHTSINVTQRYAHLAASALELAAAETVPKAPLLPQETESSQVTDWRPLAVGAHATVARLFLGVDAGSHPGDLNPRPTVYENPASSGLEAESSTGDSSVTSGLWAPRAAGYAEALLCR